MHISLQIPHQNANDYQDKEKNINFSCSLQISHVVNERLRKKKIENHFKISK